MVRRARRRCPSDLSDSQGALVEPALPAAAPVGRHERRDRRDLVDANLYVVQSECAWRTLPSEYPPWQSVCYCLAPGVTVRVHDMLREQARTRCRIQLAFSASALRPADTNARGNELPRAGGLARRLVASPRSGIALCSRSVASDPDTVSALLRDTLNPGSYR